MEKKGVGMVLKALKLRVYYSSMAINRLSVLRWHGTAMNLI
tara:strand:+ start:344 stop:466 length:123 start_codon:yes stop_codon:yes gene_type:complete